MTELNNLVFQALGDASMAWDKTPKGVFDSERCQEIGTKLINDIIELKRTDERNIEIWDYLRNKLAFLGDNNKKAKQIFNYITK